MTDKPKSASNNLRRLAWLLDSSIRLPGGFRVGLDGIIGLIPGVGDLLAACLSSYIVGQAALLNVPGIVLVRMVTNVALELFVGMIPIVGDVFDFAFKANERNIKLIDTHLNAPGHNRKHSKRLVIGSLVVTLLVLVAIAALFFKLMQLLWSSITM